MHTFSFSIDATVSFSSPTFTAVEESQVATICVTLEDDTERNVTVTLASNEQSLTIAYQYFFVSTTNLVPLPADDFVNFSTSLTFTIGESGREICHNVSVTDDDVLEDTETYTITLSSSDEDIIIQSPTASLVIVDEADGKLNPKRKTSLAQYKVPVFSLQQ